ncbi:hypothetical protein DFJ73DRAFT_815592 [Zopfochytrium polystomum]|nr:hypothetical protein DFJ73DRAFT_815592 [Zopfochytrium polystomum]
MNSNSSFTSRLASVAGSAGGSVFGSASSLGQNAASFGGFAAANSGANSTTLAFGSGSFAGGNSGFSGFGQPTTGSAFGSVSGPNAMGRTPSTASAFATAAPFGASGAAGGNTAPFMQSGGNASAFGGQKQGSFGANGSNKFGVFGRSDNPGSTKKDAPPQQLVEGTRKDMQSERPIWKLSSFGYCPGEPCMMSGLEISPEEARMFCWIAMKKGSLQNEIGIFQQLNTIVNQAAEEVRRDPVSHWTKMRANSVEPSKMSERFSQSLQTAVNEVFASSNGFQQQQQTGGIGPSTTSQTHSSGATSSQPFPFGLPAAQHSAAPSFVSPSPSSFSFVPSTAQSSAGPAATNQGQGFGQSPPSSAGTFNFVAKPNLASQQAASSTVSSSTQGTGAKAANFSFVAPKAGASSAHGTSSAPGIASTAASASLFGEFFGSAHLSSVIHPSEIPLSEEDEAQFNAPAFWDGGGGIPEAPPPMKYR